MPLFERKPRNMQDLYNDPDLIARTFRLFGCSEAIVAYIRTLEDPKADTMANALEGATNWFFENDDRLGGWSPRRRPKYQERTDVEHRVEVAP